jgi:hypothetical protein
MFSQKNIVITIGNYGAVVALHDGCEIKNKIYLDELNDDAKKELGVLLSKNKSAPIYVLLDTIDQSYRKKVYPSVKKSDLLRIIKRDLINDSDKESLKNYIILNQKKLPAKQRANNRWECLFVSSSSSEIINKWLEFLLDASNRLVGIYMLPIEAFNLFKPLKNSIKSQSKVQNKKNDLYCLVMQNKVSGIRQIVFSDQGIIFTRVVNYNFEQADFLEKYEQDIYSTFEYLKRLFPDLLMAELDIVNIFPSKVLEAIKSINNVELNFVNQTPHEIAKKIGYAKLLPQDSNFCDLLISKVFSKEKKILKFTTPKITLLDKFFFILRSSYYLNLFLVITICAAALFTLSAKDKVAEIIETAEVEKFSAMQELTKLKRAALEIEQSDESVEAIDFEQIADFGKMEELLGSVGGNFIEFYIKLKFLKTFNVKLDHFSYSLVGFNAKFPTKTSNYNISFGGKLFNQGGDIEDLFTEFDTLTNEVKINLEGNKVEYPALPQNIDFNKKYYDFPVDFTVTK